MRTPVRLIHVHHYVVWCSINRNTTFALRHQVLQIVSCLVHWHPQIHSSTVLGLTSSNSLVYPETGNWTAASRQKKSIRCPPRAGSALSMLTVDIHFKIRKRERKSSLPEKHCTLLFYLLTSTQIFPNRFPFCAGVIKFIRHKEVLTSNIVS